MARQFEGRRVAALVIGAIVLTAVIPPAAAYALAQWRITRALTLAHDAAAPLAAQQDDLRRVAGRQPIMCGPGRMPNGQGSGAAWVGAPVAAGGTFDAIWPRDPWGRCYLLNVSRVLSGEGGLLISGGPNGTIETPIDASSPSGDDIGVLVR